MRLTEDSFGSLPGELIKKFSEQFKQPEMFFKHNGEIVALHMEPKKSSIKRQLHERKEPGKAAEHKPKPRRHEPPEL